MAAMFRRQRIFLPFAEKNRAVVPLTSSVAGAQMVAQTVGKLLLIHCEGEDIIAGMGRLGYFLGHLTGLNGIVGDDNHEDITAAQTVHDGSGPVGGVDVAGRDPAADARVLQMVTHGVGDDFIRGTVADKDKMFFCIHGDLLSFRKDVVLPIDKIAGGISSLLIEAGV